MERSSLALPIADEELNLFGVLAVYLMTNAAVTGATFDIDGGQQLVQG
jgi:hypothetical protein